MRTSTIGALLFLVFCMCWSPAGGQSISAVTLGRDTVANAVNGSLYLTTIPAFRNGKTLTGNTVRVGGLIRNVRYQVRMTANGQPANGSASIPFSQFRVIATDMRNTSGHKFQLFTLNNTTSPLGTQGASPTATNGVALGTFEIIGGGGDNGLVEISFNLVCLPNSGTSNLVPGDNVTPRVYSGMNLVFSLWRIDVVTNAYTLLGQLAPSPNFTMGIRNAIELTLNTAAPVAFRLSTARAYQQGQTVSYHQQMTVSSNNPFNILAYTNSDGLANTNTIKKIPVNQVSARVTTSGVGAVASAVTLGAGTNAAVLAVGAPRGFDRVFDLEYNLVSGRGLLVPGGLYNTGLSFLAYQQ